MAHSDAVIVAAVRTPVGIGKPEKGKLSGIRPDELAALTLAEVVRRAGVDKAQVEDIVMGCVSPIGEQGLNIGRVAALIADFPVETCAVSINRMCGSSEQAIHFATQEIISGTVDVAIGAGVESMSRVPMGSDMAGASFSDKLIARYPLVPQGLSAEMVAAKWHITREEADAFSLESHRRAATATADGRFREEILPVDELARSHNLDAEVSRIHGEEVYVSRDDRVGFAALSECDEIVVVRVATDRTRRSLRVDDEDRLLFRACTIVRR